jgi:hypothetical protein
LATEIENVVLDQNPNDLVADAEVAIDEAIEHRSHRQPLDLGGSALVACGQKLPRLGGDTLPPATTAEP